jgi:hypothetical protein
MGTGPTGSALALELHEVANNFHNVGGLNNLIN